MTDASTKMAEALDQLMEGCEWRCLRGDWGWHSKAMPSNAALTAAREALAAHRAEQQAAAMAEVATDKAGLLVESAEETA